MNFVEYCSVKTEIGSITLGASGDFLQEVHLPYSGFQPKLESGNPVLHLAKKELLSYFAGDLKKFSTPLLPEGTEFQKKVFWSLAEIPYGETVAYSDLAPFVQEGNPRSLGTACGKNPLCIFLPCHRVLRKDRGLGGFSGGLEVKRFLLALEQRYK